MTTTYRDAVPDDAPALVVLFTEVFMDTFGHLYRPADVEEFLAGNNAEKWRGFLADRDNYAIRVAERDGRLLGFVELAPRKLPYETTQPSIELRRLYLLKQAHGTGAADTLMRWALEEASRRGAKEVILSVFVDNHRARRFYQRYGFEEVGKFDFMVGSHADEDLILRHIIMNALA
jgi:ribosomal protein S18 acetylase RimI-like enzyme